MRPATVLDPTVVPWVDDPRWLTIADACERLKARQSRSGSVNLAEHRAHDVEQTVHDLITAMRMLATDVPDDAHYLQALEADLLAWIGSGFAAPDFTGSLRAFDADRPGMHVLVTPMVAGSRRQAFEAMIVHTDSTGATDVLGATSGVDPRGIDLLPVAV